MTNKICFLRTIIIIILMCGISACTTVPERYKATNIITLGELTDGVTLLGAPLPASELPNVDVLGISEEMEEFLEEHVLRVRGLPGRSRQLSRALFDEDKLGIIYDSSQTYTAREAFENKSGNCLAFSFLYTAFAKRAGLDTNFQEVMIFPEWGSVDDEIYLDIRHINVHLEIYQIGRYTVDIDRIALNRSLKTKALTENHVIALYYGNIGAELMIEDKNEEAFKYIVKGIELEPKEPSLWANLGVLYRRNGYYDHAEKAYFTALELDMRNRSALTNLSFLYHETGNQERADYYQNLAKTYQAKNPYFRFAKARRALELMQFKMALYHIDYAIRKNESEARFYELKAEIHTMLGNSREASKALKIAKNIKAESS